MTVSSVQYLHKRSSNEDIYLFDISAYRWQKHVHRKKMEVSCCEESRYDKEAVTIESLSCVAPNGDLDERWRWPINRNSAYGLRIPRDK